jgi:hypothetical protein
MDTVLRLRSFGRYSFEQNEFGIVSSKVGRLPGDDGKHEMSFRIRKGKSVSSPIQQILTGQ